MTKNKDVTTEDLAVMISKGFENTATKDGLETLKNEMNEGFEKVDERFDGKNEICGS